MKADSSCKITPAMMGEIANFGTIFAIVAACVLAKVVYLDLVLGSSMPLWPYLMVGLLAAMIAHFVFGMVRVQSHPHGHWQRIRFARIVTGLGLTFLILTALGYALKIGEDFSRGWMLIWFVLAVLSVEVVQNMSKRYLRRLSSRGYFKQRVAIYGGGEITRKLTDRWALRQPEIEIVGIYEPYGRKAAPTVRSADVGVAIAGRHRGEVGGDLVQLIRDARANMFDHVVIALPAIELDRIKETLADLYDLPIRVDLALGGLSFEFDQLRFFRLGDVNLVEIQKTPLAEWSPWKKAAFDYVLGAVVLVLLLPLFAVISVAIRLDSPGPVFFRQRRHGFNNQEIEVLKFRTMYVGGQRVADDSVPQATRNDPRVTRVGRFLRTTSLDELPQLLNVLRGEMSIVGPRPHAVEHNVVFDRIIDNYASRHKIKPGITGWAQVNGFRGETDVPEKLMKRVEYDLYYTENWSLWFDFKILFLLTIPTVLRRQNAY